MAAHAHTPSNPLRRATLLGAATAIVAGSGITAGFAASIADALPSEPDSSSITAAGLRLSELCALEDKGVTPAEEDAITQEQTMLNAAIVEGFPQSMSDALVLLMAAVGKIDANNLHRDGTFGYERAGVLVQRVMRFLAERAGIDLADIGGSYFLPPLNRQQLALTGSLASAAAAFHGVTAEVGAERHREYALMVRRLIAAERASA